MTSKTPKSHKKATKNAKAIQDPVKSIKAPEIDVTDLTAIDNKKYAPKGIDIDRIRDLIQIKGTTARSCQGPRMQQRAYLSAV